MSPVEFVAFWTTVFAYMAGAGAALAGLVFRRERPMTAGIAACALGLASHLVAVGARIAFTGHLLSAGRTKSGV